MTNSDNADQGRGVVVRWRLLAERRLNHLIELYESGRWRLYHREAEFLDMVQEARAALKAWETLAPPDGGRDKPVEVAVAQEAEGMAPAAPSIVPLSADRVGAENELRKS
jgi:uncharacterized repeat protein (TIGR03809 family)